MDTAVNRRAQSRIGVLVPFTNTNLEPDMALLCPEGATVHTARLGGYDVDAVPDAGQMAGLGASSMEEPLRLLGGVRPTVVLYGCTSATLAHGDAFDRDLAAAIHRATGAETVTAAGALVRAIRHFGAARVAFASPYVPALNDLGIAFLKQNAIETVSRADVPDDLGNYGQGAMDLDEIVALGVRADSAEADLLVLSCTDMRAVEAVTQLEARLGKPVVTSNQAMVWRALQILGLPHNGVPCGRLLAAPLPDY